ncbi:MAG: hypothetical protein A2W22_04240 [Candidatus Levybacteria bacterium RBG_16_35_11]|nr:MAG: hypothetical protein A2W22_04240 [Candidatus Levybacteria bacterium RBG_16_35_11]
MNKIKCPHCGKQVEISEAIKHQVEEAVRIEEKEKSKLEVEKLKKEIEKRLKEDLEFKMKDSKNELEEAKRRNKELQENLLEMNKNFREIKESSEKKELENQKKMNEELEKMREEVGKTASEKAKLRELELEKKLADTQKALEDAQRKTRQGSQQLQGEVMELNLEDQLKETFPYDEFLPIPKGIEGADIWQKVKNKHGQEAGLFVWEIKRTKAFSKGWLPKLREDCRKVNGSVSILITDTLPDTISYFGREAGVWICSFEYALVLANVLRDSLLQLAIAKSSASHKDEHLQEIYDYITSEAFRHKIEAHFESVKTLKIDLDSEKRAMERIWKKREVEIQRLDKSMSQMFGEIQGVVGPQLEAPRNLEIEAGEEIEE